jgi:hypothetical protein
MSLVVSDASSKRLDLTSMYCIIPTMSQHNFIRAFINWSTIGIIFLNYSFYAFYMTLGRSTSLLTDCDKMYHLMSITCPK